MKLEPPEKEMSEWPFDWWKEGLPICLLGAAADGLEWCRFMRKKFGHLISPDGRGKLDACIRELETRITNA